MSRKQIQKILVPLDGSSNSQRSLATALHLATEHEASISAVYVIHKLQKGVGRKKMGEADPSFIVEAKKLAEKNGIPFHSRILEGDPGHAIVEYSNTRDIDLIVIGARGLGTFKKIFLGSVSSYVLHKSKVAVMLVR
ncbi:MAG TPA: universal stress protein [Candidatus Nitrosotalea sp.]|nr:universal stress protein [Candidatus Nitrosotalea sp.]